MFWIFVSFFLCLLICLFVVFMFGGEIFRHDLLYVQDISWLGDILQDDNKITSPSAHNLVAPLHLLYRFKDYQSRSFNNSESLIPSLYHVRDMFTFRD